MNICYVFVGFAAMHEWWIDSFISAEREIIFFLQILSVRRHSFSLLSEEVDFQQGCRIRLVTLDVLQCTENVLSEDG